jgi:hypothetical protein
LSSTAPPAEDSNWQQRRIPPILSAASGNHGLIRVMSLQESRKAGLFKVMVGRERLGNVSLFHDEKRNAIG